MAFALVVVTLKYVFSGTDADPTSGSAETASDLVPNPTVARGVLGAPTNFEQYRFFELPNGLDKAEIHDIDFHDGAMWLGTDGGLVKVVDRDVTVYRQFSDWPFEWVRNLAVTPYGIAASVHVARGNTGGRSANTHLFSAEDEEWREIGPNVLDQAWHEGHLYQVSSRLVRRDPRDDWQESVVDDSICGGSPSSLKMKVIENEIWIVGEGAVFEGAPRRRIRVPIGCGVIRHTPSNGRSVVYDTTHGLNHDHGWDLDGGDGEVYVSHSVKHDRLSRFDIGLERWSALGTRGSGNRVFVSSDDIWLARGSPRRPMYRIDRDTGEGRFFSTISEGTYFSAIGTNDEEIWLGVYERHWSDSTYSITSRLALVVDE